MGNYQAKENELLSKPEEKPTLEDFEIIKFIGKGKFGKVYQIRQIESGRYYAMKVLKKSVIYQYNQAAQTFEERNILAYISHPFIVKLRYAFRTVNSLNFILDYINGGEIFKHLSHMRRFPESWVKFYAAEVLCALEYLHEQNIVYRDLKPENVLLDKKGHIKLTDFGLSKNIYMEKTETICGTPAYIAPEMLIGEGYDTAVDIWSLGIFMFELASGTTPFYHKNRVMMCKKIMREDIKFPLFFSEELKDLISKFLIKNSSERLDLKRAKRHPFFAEIDWRDLEDENVVPPLDPECPRYEDTKHYEHIGNDSVESPELFSGNLGSFEGFSFVAENTTSSLDTEDIMDSF